MDTITPTLSRGAREQKVGVRRVAALGLLWPFMRPYRWRAVGAATALAVAAGLVLGLGQGVRRLIDQGFATADRGHLDQAALVMVGVVVALGVTTGVRFYLVSWLGERVAADIRSAMFSRVLTLSPPFFETMRTGDVLTRLNTDTVLLQGLVGSAVSQWLRSLVIALGALAMLVVTSAKLAGIVVLVVPFVVLPLVVFGRRERALARVAQDRIADLGAYAEETVNALRTVQAFTHEAVDRARFGERIEASVAAAMRRVSVRAMLIGLIIVLGFGAITFSLWVGGLDVVQGRLSGGELSAFVFYAVLVATSTAGIAELWGEVQRASGAAARIGELLAERPIVEAPADPVALPAVRQGGSEVRFEGVAFQYRLRRRPQIRWLALSPPQPCRIRPDRRARRAPHARRDVRHHGALPPFRQRTRRNAGRSPLRADAHDAMAQYQSRFHLHRITDGVSRRAAR